MADGSFNSDFRVCWARDAYLVSIQTWAGQSWSKAQLRREGHHHEHEYLHPQIPCRISVALPAPAGYDGRGFGRRQKRKEELPRRAQVRRTAAVGYGRAALRAGALG